MTAQILQRIKGESTHYAGAIDPAGIVNKWESDPAKACTIDEPTYKKVLDTYKDNTSNALFALVPEVTTAPADGEQVKKLKENLEAAHTAAAKGSKELADVKRENDLLKKENERLKTAAPAPHPAQVTTQPTERKAEKKQVEIHTTKFEPDTITIAAGDCICFTNFVAMKHTVTFADKAIESSGQLEKEDTFEAKFPTAGKFPYHCQNHPEMKGVVTVTAPAKA